jgi:SAM-dependent methyltransferase
VTTETEPAVGGVARTVMTLTDALHTAAAVRAASLTGMLDALTSESLTADDIAQRCAVAPRQTGLILAALCALGLVSQDDTGRYHGVHGLLGFADFSRQEADALEGVLRAGPLRHEVDHSADAGRLYPDVVPVLGQLLSDAAVAAAQVLGPVGEVLEAGAGASPWGIAVARADPQARITALDLPSVLPRTRAAVSAAGLSERFRFRPGDMFATPLEPAGFDTVLLGNVCHLFDEFECARLIARLAGALRPGGRLVIVDVLRQPIRFGDRDSAALALYELGLSLRTASGRVHAGDDYDRWTRAAGLSGVQISALDVQPPLQVLIATAPG